MQYKKLIAICLIGLTLGQAATVPQYPVYEPKSISEQSQERMSSERKYAEKPNASKKVGHEDLEDVSSNQIQDTVGAGFSWSNIVGMLMQMLLGQGAAGIAGPSKNDIEDGTPSASPWSNLLTVGLKVLSAILGGNQQSVDGIDKVDNQSSPMQGVVTAVLGAVLGPGRNPEVITMAKQATEFINIVVNLLDALKTSFSHRSMSARSLGKRDTMSEAAVASISMLKGYMRSMKSYSMEGESDDESRLGCMERALCEASAECVATINGKSTIFCQLGSYATSYLLQRQSGIGFEALNEAGRSGRSGKDCRQLFTSCNAI
ncbi:uncharacterized protein LOC122860896 isoform X1 [Aphidius gifuensis]|uniref:uncharacterized protein LOC122860896 isoform X1 n=1 Tax=Aphidius gifuensis TaxID=684658 RepID=UPI001CDBA255|nr:uncharacterized protein LOC122860896 isoform X1 [Aphidius gifuensis]XP_044020888.1 uncharacterized protein LOC122860896 isoform X1 [Aphidius gifuensis]